MKSVLIDICSVCRNRCRYCLPHALGLRQAAIMAPLTFCAVCDILAREGYGRAYLYLSGEPLLHPAFPQLLAGARKCFAVVQVATKLQAPFNGTEIREAMSGAGAEVEWLVGVDGLDQATLRESCPGASIERLADNLATLAVACSGLRCDLIACTVRTRYTEPHLHAIRTHCVRLGYRWSERDLGSANTDLATADFAAWFRGALPTGGNHRLAETKSGMPSSRRGEVCTDQLDPCIHPNGDVSVCCHDQLGRGIVGNVITAGSLQTVLESQKAIEMYALCRSKAAPFCVGCS